VDPLAGVDPIRLVGVTEAVADVESSVTMTVCARRVAAMMVAACSSTVNGWSVPGKLQANRARIRVDAASINFKL
jgi:hypothetical protein